MWVAIAIALAGGFVLFLIGYAAQVAPYFPRYFDQLSGYVGLYRAHYTLADPGLPFADRFQAVSPVLLDLRGWAVPWLATAAGFVFGANRLAFASINYVFLVAIVVALAAAMARRCDAWTAGTAIGLLLTSRSVFQATGGLHDLRLDFAGLAMFGIFVLALWRMAETPDPRRVALAALAYAAALWSRSVTGAYGLIAIGVFGIAALALAVLRRDLAWRARWRAAFALGLAAGAIFALYVALHWRAIDGYYFNLMRTDESRIRLAEFGLSSRAELFGFYLQSAWQHFRPLVQWFGATLGLVVAAIAVARMRGKDLAEAAAAAPAGPALAVVGAAVVGVLVPVLAYAPSPVAIGVLSVPLAAFGAFALAAARSAVPWRRVGHAIALLPLVAGLWISARAMARPPIRHPLEIPVAEAHNRLYDSIATDGGGTVAWMTVSEGTNPAAFAVHLYETGRAAQVGGLRYTETGIFAIDADTARTRIAEADGVVIWRRFPPDYPYPAVASLRDTREAWQPLLDRDFALRYEFPMAGGTIAYYRRTAPRG